MPQAPAWESQRSRAKDNVVMATFFWYGKGADLAARPFTVLALGQLA